MTRTELHVFYGSNKGWKTYKLSPSVTDRIQEFDTDGKMTAFSWEFTP